MKDKIKIVIADNSIEFAKELKNYINTYEDMKVIKIARDGAMAIKVIKKLNPDVALIDIIMPYIDGIGVLEMMNTKEVDNKTKYIMYSEIDKDTIIQKTKLLGSKHYFIKPINKERLIKRIREIYYSF